MTYGRRHTLEVWGDYACFTRPEAKVERLSYPVITPSAARGIFDAIYWSAQDDFYWQIHSIEVLKPPKYIALRRNEVKNIGPAERTILLWADGRQDIKTVRADESEQGSGRTDRQTMALKDVHYRLTASMCSRSHKPAQARDDQFQRRASRGVCRFQPSLGCREFPAYFSLEPSQLRLIDLDLDLGLMLYDVFDLARSKQKKTASVSLFQASLSGGVLTVPEFGSRAVLKG